LGDLHPLGAKNVLNKCDRFEDDYKEFVLGKLTEFGILTTNSESTQSSIGLDVQGVYYYTVSPSKKHVTTFSIITSTISVRLQ